MSKSKGNVVSADDMINRFGADTGRLFELFAAPPEKEMDWTDSGAEGAHRFLGRVYRFVTRNADRDLPPGPCAGDAKVLRKLHQTIRKITGDFETRWHFNTCVAAIMELVNELYANENEISAPVMRDCIRDLVLILHPFAPYVTQELWEELGNDGARPIFKHPWPPFDPELAKDDEVEVVVQVNGKVRSHMLLRPGTSGPELERLALADPKVQPLIVGKLVVKIIVVPDKLVNIVVK
jgi:leucyl-tRNA synthetase